MGIRLATPWKHPNGTFYLRERVPRDVIGEVLGSTVSLPWQGTQKRIKLGEFVKFSLETKDPKIARERHRAAAAAVQDLWRLVRPDQLPTAQRDQAAATFIHRPERQDDQNGPVSIGTLFELWERDHQLEGRPKKTVADFRQKVGCFADYVGQKDVKAVSPRDVIGWCDSLRHERGLSSKTVADKYLVALRAVFRVARARQVIAHDPTEGVRVRTSGRQVDRDPGFTTEEAVRILKAAHSSPGSLTKAADETKQIISWVPSGKRIRLRHTIGDQQQGRLLPTLGSSARENP